MNLVETIKGIQGAVGATPDGIFGPLTAGRVLAELNNKNRIAQPPVPRETVIATDEGNIAQLDSRTVAAIRTLDPKARGRFVKFSLLANATAATYGCQYVMVSGNRTWKEQDALYAQGRTSPGSIVTRARGGQSDHNFGIAGDFGVFRARVYLDESEPELAGKIHRACSVHAVACGLEWGGSWKSIKDEPHYQIFTGMTLAQMRAAYAASGSVL